MLQQTLGLLFSDSRLRLKKMAEFAKGMILDIGFADIPNPYLQGKIIGLDLQTAPKPDNYGMIIINDISNSCFKDSIFDTIVAGEIIEHLESPVEFIKQCHQLLNSGGKLIISTPNPYYPPVILLNWLMIRKFYYSPQHVFEIAPRFMVRILENNGFRSVKTISGGIIIPLGGNRFFTLPSPKAICYQMIYVAEAE